MASLNYLIENMFFMVLYGNNVYLLAIVFATLSNFLKCLF